MKNNKGFTIVEFIVVFALILSIGGIFSINALKTLKKNKDEEVKMYINTVKSAANTYVSINEEVLKNLYDGTNTTIKIKISELKKEGLIDNNLIDPLTGDNVDNNKTIDITLNNDGELIFNYNK